MARVIDQDALDSPNLKILDINNPPTKDVPYQPFPKMIYLHPKDKTKEHKFHVVHSDEELEAAMKKGYRKQPHIPEAPPEDLKDFDTSEYEVEEKRGPGRPKAS